MCLPGSPQTTTMTNSIILGRIRGIPVGLHWSLLFIFGLLTISLGRGYLPQEYPGLGPATTWALAALTAGLLFASVLLHELGHAWAAQRDGVPVRGITLFVFGGVAELASDARTPGSEFRIAIAGPLVSLALAAIFAGLWWLDAGIQVLAAPSEWLVRINLSLALFNLIPGFPLDGGRVLRAAVWQWTGDPLRSTQVAAVAGQLAAFALIGVGIAVAVSGSLLNGMWLGFIGWFLQNAAASSYASATIAQHVRGVRAGHVIDLDAPTAPAWETLDALVHGRILPTGRRWFLVLDGNRVAGLVTLRDVASVPQAEWATTRVSAVMQPADRIVRVTPETELVTALRAMDDGAVAQVPVMDGDRVSGVLCRERALRQVRLRAELRLPPTTEAA